MTNKPPITVLMSVYNGAGFIRSAIDSILNQTFENFELLIINDGSTDETSAIISSYHDQRIKHFQNEINIGLTKSLNRGIELSNGKYIARMDADDVSFPDRLKYQYDFMESNPDYILIGSGAVLIDEGDNIIGELYRPFDFDQITGHIFFFNPFIHSTVCFKKDVIKAIGKYNEQIKRAQDYELWMRLLASKYKAFILPELLVKHREHAKSIESEYFDEQESGALMSLKSVINNELRLNADYEIVHLFRELKNYKRKLSFLKQVSFVIFIFQFRLRYKNIFKSKIAYDIFNNQIINLFNNIKNKNKILSGLING